MSHITGGGLVENTERVLRDGQHLNVNWDAWKLPELFAKLQEWGSVSDEEIRRVFNVGIGLVLIVSPEAADEIMNLIRARKEEVIRIGRVET